MLELRHLRELQALFECGSFAAAAAQLCITTSALSHQIASIEKWLDVEIISRKTRPFQFTSNGLLLLDLAQQVIPMIDGAVTQLKDQQLNISHKLVVASECHCCFDWLIHVLNAYNQAYPDIELDFMTAFEDSPHQLLLDGEVDVLITSDRKKVDGIHYAKLFEYESRLVVSPQHPLLYETDLSPERLAKETLICHPVELNRLDIYNHYFTPANVEPKHVRRTQLTPMLIQLVSNQRGIAALPDWVVYDFERQGLVKTLRMPVDDGNGLLCTLYAAYREAQTAQTYFTEFLNQMKKYAQQRDTFYLR